MLAAAGAHVTGMDISPHLIEQARQKDPSGAIEYRVADLSERLLDHAGSFEAVASTAVLAFNNPYYGLLSPA